MRILFVEFDGVLHLASATSRVRPQGLLKTSVQRAWLLDAGQLQRLLQTQLETPAEELQAQAISTAQRRAWQAGCNLRGRLAAAVGD